MGKATLIATIAVAFAAILYLNNSHDIERSTDAKNAEHYNNQAVRELALNGRRLVLAGWMNSGGISSSSPFTTINQDGGTITVKDYTLSGTVLDYTVQAKLNNAVHEVRSRFRWNNFGLNPVQLRVTDIDFDVSPDAELNIGSIAIDDQSLDELDQSLVDELGLAGSLGELGLGASDVISTVESELANEGFGGVNVILINDAFRSSHDSEPGVFFTEQAKQAVDTYMLNHPSAIQVTNDINTIGGTFGDGAYDVLRVDGDLFLANDFQGEGILVVEGQLNIPAGINFQWDGLILMAPPSDQLNPQLNLSGNVNINGSLIVIHEGMINAGHMDITSFRDYSGVWSSPYGVDKKQLDLSWPWFMYHRHDYTALYGNDVIFTSNILAERIHEVEHYMHETLSTLSPSDSIFFELNNTNNHGRGILTLEVNGTPRTSYPVAAGFDPLYANPVNQYRSSTFKVSDLNYLELLITRLSALRKLWDPTPPDTYPGCTVYGGIGGPPCVGADYNRMNSLTLRMYKRQAGVDFKVFETALYWHRRVDEEDEFENEMNDLVNTINSTSYGLDATIGPNTVINEDPFVLSTMGAFGGFGIGITHLGTWHRHWAPDDPQNPYYAGD